VLTYSSPHCYMWNTETRRNLCLLLDYILPNKQCLLLHPQTAVKCTSLPQFVVNTSKHSCISYFAVRKPQTVFSTWSKSTSITKPIHKYHIRIFYMCKDVWHCQKNYQTASGYNYSHMLFRVLSACHLFQTCTNIRSVCANFIELYIHTHCV
jgi:hypothetical protein